MQLKCRSVNINRLDILNLVFFWYWWNHSLIFFTEYFCSDISYAALLFRYYFYFYFYVFFFSFFNQDTVKFWNVEHLKMKNVLNLEHVGNPHLSCRYVALKLKTWAVLVLPLCISFENIWILKGNIELKKKQLINMVTWELFKVVSVKLEVCF